MSGNTRSHHPPSTLEMFGQSQSSSIGTVDTRVAGGDMFSTTFNYTSNVYASASQPSGGSDHANTSSSSTLNPTIRQGGEVQRLLYRLLQPFWIFPKGPTGRGPDDFSLAPLDEQSDLQASVRTSGEIYVSSLLKSGNGLPCWKPKPRNPICAGTGIVPGDVGTYTVGDGYSKIFNLWENDQSVRHTSSSRSRHPPYQIPGSRKPSNLVTSDELAEGHALVQGVSYDAIYEPDEQTLSGFRFQHVDAHQQGALLAMTSTGTLEELEDLDKATLREYLCHNAGAIYKYANSLRPISDGEALYIITGCIKSESWALAAFNHPQPHFLPRLIRQSSSYVWRSPGTFNAYSGRSTAPGSRDQSLFLRGFKLEFSQSFRSQIRSALAQPSEGDAPGGDGSSTSRAPDPDDFNEPSDGGAPRGQGGNQGGFPTASKNANQEAADNEFHVTSFPDSLDCRSCHPCDTINRFLLEKTGSDFALSHDDDWRFLLEKWASEPGRNGMTDETGGALGIGIIFVQNGVARLIDVPTEHESVVASTNTPESTCDPRQGMSKSVHMSVPTSQTRATPVTEPAADVQTLIRPYLEPYIHTVNRVAFGERTVIVMSSKVAPASYGTEKRFVCPPPTAILIGNSWWAEVVRQGEGPKLCPPSVVISISDQSIAQESSITWAEPAGDSFEEGHPPTGTTYIGRCVAKKVSIVCNDQASQNVEALFKITAPASDEEPEKVIGVFPSKPIKVTGKPSRNVQRTKNLGLCITHGSMICLFHRLRPQTVSAKYLCVSNSRSSLKGSDGAYLTNLDQQTRQTVASFVARTDSWDPFAIYLVDISKPGIGVHGPPPPPQPGYPSIPPNAVPWDGDSDIPIYYNQTVVLQCMTSGVVSPVLAVRKVDHQTTVLGGGLGGFQEGVEKHSDYCCPGEVCGDPVSQLQKVAFEVYKHNTEPDEPGTPGVSGSFLSCIGEKVNTYRPIDGRRWSATVDSTLSYAAPRFPLSPTTKYGAGAYVGQGGGESEPVSSSSESSVDLPPNPSRRVKKKKSTSSIGGAAKRAGRNHHRSNSVGSVSSRWGGGDAAHESGRLRHKVSASSIGSMAKTSGRRRRRSGSAGSASSQRGYGGDAASSGAVWEVDVSETSMWFIVGTDQVRYDFYVPPALYGGQHSISPNRVRVPFKPVTPFPIVIKYLPLGDADECAPNRTDSQSPVVLTKQNAFAAKALTLLGENFSKTDRLHVFFGSEPSPYVEVRCAEVIEFLPPERGPQNERRPIILARGDGVLFPSNVLYP